MNPRLVPAPTTQDMADASAVVRTHLPATPVVTANNGGPALVLKVESLLPTGSFKVRGGLAAVAASVRRRPQARVVAASAGNHGLGVAWAAARLGIDATIVIPETAATVKSAALARFPAEVLRVGTSYDEAEKFALNAVADGITFVSPYNDPHVIAGQATVGAELREQVRDLACVVAPVGGGGLVSGIGLALAGTGIPVIGVEAAQSAAMRAALQAGMARPVVVGPTLADGLAGNLEPGSVTIDLVRSHVADVVMVTEDEIVAAIRRLALEHGLVAEGSGAVAFAAVLAARVPPVSGTTAVVVSGRNIDGATLLSVLASPVEPVTGQ
jgi:threonine dehydratase